MRESSRSFDSPSRPLGLAQDDSERGRRFRDICTRVKVRLRSFFGIVLAGLREIFDESAYERFLSRTGTFRSVASYREFLRERETAMAQRPRCC